jgi:hypothetical protein
MEHGVIRIQGEISTHEAPLYWSITGAGVPGRPNHVRRSEIVGGFVSITPAPVGASASSIKYRPTVPDALPRPSALAPRFLDRLWMWLDNSPVDRQAP